MSDDEVEQSRETRDKIDNGTIGDDGGNQGTSGSGNKSTTTNPFQKLIDLVKAHNEKVAQERLDDFKENFGDMTGGLELDDVLANYNRQTGENLTAEDMRVLFSNNPLDYIKAQRMLLDNENLHVKLREMLNVNVPKDLSSMKALTQGNNPEWIKMEYHMSLYHDPVNHFKYVSADGRREAVYDVKSGKLITRDTILTKGKYKGQLGSKIYGTYNFGPPTIAKIGHFLKDMNTSDYWSGKRK